MEKYEIIKYLSNFKQRLYEITKTIDINLLKSEITNLENQTQSEKFFNDSKTAQNVLKKLKSKKGLDNDINSIKQSFEDLEVFLQMYEEEETTQLLEELETNINIFNVTLQNFELKVLLNNEYDDNPAIIELHPGAGGVESQDWTEMILRMYKRYAERSGYKFEITDYLDGEVAGIKSVTFIITGDFAYGKLKGENGVHRLIRLSPFDSNSRRHTSFCGCKVIPFINDDIEIDIKSDELKVDVYRSSGAGGQHVNTTDSAVRITHLPTGIVVTCQNQRSQIQNRERAMQVLKAKLYEIELNSKEEEKKKISGKIKDNNFGSQIRTYTFHPYSLVKDHRTNVENTNTNAVMDGDIDLFIDSYLKYLVSNND